MPSISEVVTVLKNILSYFECKRCGECCVCAPIFLYDEEVDTYSKLYGNSFFDMLDENIVDNHLKAPCGFLENKLCKLHNIRKPLTCAIYPFSLKNKSLFKSSLYDSVGISHEKYIVSSIYIDATLCKVGMEIDKEFLNFCEYNKIKATPLNNVTNIRRFGYIYLIPFYAFIKKKHLINRTSQALSK